MFVEPHFAFDRFVLIPGRPLLLEDGTPVRIGRRALDLLTALVRRPGNVVSKDELVAHAWPDQDVDEANLKVNIAALRRALGDDSDRPRFIATVVGRGYRFVAPVQAPDEVDTSPSAGIVSSGPKTNLPDVATTIFGRGETIASILQELDGSRLVSIVGPGGIGKTTVALAVAHRAADSFEDGAWFVDLAALRSSSLVDDAVAMVTGPQVRTRKMLLVLDNCEHVIDSVASCAERLLANARYIKMLATSRESFCIRGERVRRLSGLDAPAAVEMFVERAKRVAPSFVLSDANRPIVERICQRVDGLALAIERIAMRVDTMNLPAILDHIDGRAHLVDGDATVIDRHRTIASTVAWSYELLSTSERAVLRRLSIFDGSFTLEAACLVGAEDGVEPATVLEDVAKLVAKSLLIAMPQDGEMHYRLDRIIHDFAFAKLAEAGEVELARRREHRKDEPTR